MLYFIDIDLMDKRKLITGLDRETYLRYLESDYKQRMLEEYGDEQGLFSKGTLSEEHFLLESKKKPSFESLSSILDEEETMKQIDKEIDEE